MKFAKPLLVFIVTNIAHPAFTRGHRQPTDGSSQMRDCTTDPLCSTTLSNLQGIATSARGLTNLFVNTYSKATSNESYPMTTGLCFEFDRMVTPMQPRPLLDEVRWLRNELEMQVPTMKDLASNLTRLSESEFSGLSGLQGLARLRRSEKSTMSEVCKFCKKHEGCNLSVDRLDLIFAGAIKELSAAVEINEYAVRLWAIFRLWDTNVRRIDRLLSKMTFSLDRREDREFIDQLKSEGSDARDFLDQLPLDNELGSSVKHWLADVEHSKNQATSSERRNHAVRLACFFQMTPTKTFQLT